VALTNIAVFGDNGYVHWKWKDLGVAAPAGLVGDTPIEYEPQLSWIIKE
jgi:hypothetical protein